VGLKGYRLWVNLIQPAAPHRGGVSFRRRRRGGSLAVAVQDVIERQALKPGFRSISARVETGRLSAMGYYGSGGVNVHRGPHLAQLGRRRGELIREVGPEAAGGGGGLGSRRRGGGGRGRGSLERRRSLGVAVQVACERAKFSTTGFSRWVKGQAQGLQPGGFKLWVKLDSTAAQPRLECGGDGATAHRRGRRRRRQGGGGLGRFGGGFRRSLGRRFRRLRRRLGGHARAVALAQRGPRRRSLDVAVHKWHVKEQSL
jgi:hypothetical protein